MNLYIVFSVHARASLVETDGVLAELQSDYCAVPGMQLSGVIEGTSHAVQLKVHNCRRLREDPALYQFSGRWVNLTRAVRSHIIGSAADTGD
jgi:hypothetical protein